MAKSRKIDPAKLMLGVKKELVNANLGYSIEKAVKKIHGGQPIKETTVRITLDVSKSKYKKIRMRLIETDEKFISSYIQNLIDKDLDDG